MRVTSLETSEYHHTLHEGGSVKGESPSCSICDTGDLIFFTAESLACKDLTHSSLCELRWMERTTLTIGASLLISKLRPATGLFFSPMKLRP